MNYSALLEAGLVAWIDEATTARVVSYADAGDTTTRSLPSVTVVCAPSQDWQGLVRIPVQLTLQTNAIVDTDRAGMAALVGEVMGAIGNDNSTSIDALVASPLHFAGLSEIEQSDGDVLTTEQESTNVVSVSATAFCVVDSVTTTTTSTTTTTKP